MQYGSLLSGTDLNNFFSSQKLYHLSSTLEGSYFEAISMRCFLQTGRKGRKKQDAAVSVHPASFHQVRQKDLVKGGIDIGLNEVNFILAATKDKVLPEFLNA